MTLSNMAQGIIVLGVIIVLCIGGHFALQLPDEEEEEEIVESLDTPDMPDAYYRACADGEVEAPIFLQSPTAGAQQPYRSEPGDPPALPMNRHYRSNLYVSLQAPSETTNFDSAPFTNGILGALWPTSASNTAGTS